MRQTAANSQSWPSPPSWINVLIKPIKPSTNQAPITRSTLKKTNLNNRTKVDLPDKSCHRPLRIYSSCIKSSRRSTSKLRPLAVIRRRPSSLNRLSSLHHWPLLSFRLRRSRPCHLLTTLRSTTQRTWTYIRTHLRARSIPLLSLNSSSNNSKTRLLVNHSHSSNSSSSNWDRLSRKACPSSCQIHHRVAAELLPWTLFSSRKCPNCE